MKINEQEVKDILEIYKNIKDLIEQRLIEFRNTLKKGLHDELLSELIFCLLTPQSKAKVCYKAVLDLKRDNFNFNSNNDYLRGVRFKNKKLDYIKNALDIFKEKDSLKNLIYSFKDPLDLREWLVKNVKGLGYKEASHFLRNIGLGYNLAILDRHILKNLFKIGIIKKIPTSLTRKIYFELEEKMRFFSKSLNIPIEHLDFVLWYRETKEVFR